MRFQRLQIPGFGPFTDLELEFDSEPGDFHVLYGPNEAGKTSLLRAIGDLLFGIPAQSPDNFIHDYADLKIRCEVRNQAGRRLVFQRRKGNKNTLLDAEGQPLPEGALSPFLGSIDRPYFSAMFGLGARELREGAQHILQGEGDIGAALFSASLGGTPIKQVVEALEGEADRLFKGRATTNVSIRPACNRYKELLRQSRDGAVDPEEWARIEAELAEAEASRTRLEERISQLDQTLQWLARCEDALPTAGRLEEALHQLAQLADLPELASDFIPRTRAARDALATSQAKVQQLEVQSARLRTRLEELPSHLPVLDHADAIEQLHQDLGAHRERKKTVAALKHSREALRLTIRAGMQRLQLEGEIASLEDCRLSTPVTLAFEEAAEALKTARVEQAENARKSADLESQIADRERQLQLPPAADLANLREALSVAAEATEADRTLPTSQSEVQRLLRETTEQHRLIPGAPQDLDAAAALPVPASATIRRHHDQMEAIQRDIREREGRALEGRHEAAAIRVDLTRLQRQGELPTEEALRQARAHRDRGWNLVLAAWKGDGAGEELVPRTPLEEAYPRAVAKADAIADQLRLQAEAVAQAEEKKLQLNELEQRIATATTDATQFQARLETCQLSWQQEWSACGIAPRSPLEMQEWRDAWVAFRQQLGRLRTAQESLQRKTDQVRRARQRLAAVLDQSEEKEFSVLYEAARKRVQDGEQAAGRRMEIASQLQSLRDDLVKNQRRQVRLGCALTAATDSWKSQCQSVGLPGDTSPEAGLTLLRERTQLLSKYDEWQKQSLDSRAASEAVSGYEEAVTGKAAALGLAGGSAEAAEAALWKALSAARTARARRDQLAQELQQITADLETAQGEATRATRALDERVQLASLGSIEALEPLLSRLEQRQTLRFQVEALRNTLGGLARGQSVDEFVARVRAEDADTLAQRKTAASGEKTEAVTALEQVGETLFKLRSEKTALEQAGDAAADYRQQAESCAATLRRDGARFLRLHLAIHLLQAQIERFRKENQGPLLEQSGAIFCGLTGGAFSGLSTAYSAQDVPVLIAIRKDSQKVPVEGLSDGTRDQLYLALRLAALARYADEHEPMPLILDDLLITFDDQRAQAGLLQLAALAGRTQIFLFTHHQHLVQLCRQTLGEGQFHLHELASPDRDRVRPARH